VGVNTIFKIRFDIKSVRGYGRTKSEFYHRCGLIGSGQIQCGTRGEARGELFDLIVSRLYERRLGLLDGADGEAGDEAVEEHVVEERNRKAGDEAGGHQRAPEVHIAARQENRDPHPLPAGPFAPLPRKASLRAVLGPFKPL
jgi:hypothetical protein